MKTTPVFRPFADEETVLDVVEALRGSWWGTGPRVQELEEAFEEAFTSGTSRCVALNSATAALHLALVLGGLGAGDDVLVPACTFVADANVVRQAGARVKLVDVDPIYSCPTLTQLEAAYTPEVRALILVHFGGCPCPWTEEVTDWCNDREVILIEDCAHAPGASIRGRHVGSFGQYAAWSFHAVKPIPAGDGGMLAVPPSELPRAQALAWHGISRSTYDRSTGRKGYAWDYEVREPGFKYRMNDLTAALALGGLRRNEDRWAARQRLAEEYTLQLELRERPLDAHEPDVTPVLRALPAGLRSAWHLYQVDVRRGAEEVARRLEEYGISTSVHYRPLYHYDPYRRPAEEFPNAEANLRRRLTLPLFPLLELKEVRRIVGTLVEEAEDVAREMEG